MATMIGNETKDRSTVAELARRSGDGLDVTLTWNRLTGRLWVHGDGQDAVEPFRRPHARLLLRGRADRAAEDDRALVRDCQDAAA